MKGLRLALLATVLLACTPGLHAATLAYTNLQNLDATIAYMMPAASSQPRVVVIGDKLVEDGTKQENGWVSLLKGAYQNSVEVFSLGSNLSNSEAADAALAALLSTPKGTSAFGKVVLVILAFGSNEVHAANNGVQEPWVSPSAFEQHLGSMVQQLQAKGVGDILLVQPPPVASFKQALPYAQAVSDVARQYQVPFVDTLAAIAATPSWKTQAFKNDKEMTDLGHSTIYSRIAAEIKRQLPNISPQAMMQRMQQRNPDAAVSIAATAAGDSAQQDAAAAATSSPAKGGRARPMADVASRIIPTRPLSQTPASVAAASLQQHRARPDSEQKQQEQQASLSSAELQHEQAEIDKIEEQILADLMKEEKPAQPQQPQVQQQQQQQQQQPAAAKAQIAAAAHPAGKWDFMHVLLDQLDGAPSSPKEPSNSSGSKLTAALQQAGSQPLPTAAPAPEWHKQVPEPVNAAPAWFSKVPEPTTVTAPLAKQAPTPAHIQAAPASAAAAAAPAQEQHSWASKVPEPVNAAPAWLAKVPEPQKAALMVMPEPHLPAVLSKPSAAAAAQQPAAAAPWYTQVPEPTSETPAWLSKVPEPSPAKYAAMMQSREPAPSAVSDAAKPLQLASVVSHNTWGSSIPEPSVAAPAWFSKVPEPNAAAAAAARATHAAADATGSNKAVPAPKPAEQKPAAQAPKQPTVAPKAEDQKPAALAAKQVPAAPKTPEEPKPAAQAPKQPAAASKVEEQKPAAQAPMQPVAAPKPAEQKPAAQAPKQDAAVPKPTEQMPAAQPKQPAAAPKAVPAPKAEEPKPAAQAPKQPLAAPKPVEQKTAAQAPKQDAAAPKPAEQKPAAQAPKQPATTPKPADHKPAAQAPKQPAAAPKAEEPKPAAQAPKQDVADPKKPADHKPTAQAPKQPVAAPKSEAQPASAKATAGEPWHSKVPEPNAAQPPAWLSKVPEPQQSVKNASAMQKEEEPTAPPTALAQPGNTTPTSTWGSKVPEPAESVPTWFSSVPEPNATATAPKQAAPEQKPAAANTSAPSEVVTAPLELPPALQTWQAKVNLPPPAKPADRPLSTQPPPRKAGPIVNIKDTKKAKGSQGGRANYFAKFKPAWWDQAFGEGKGKEDQPDPEAVATFTNTFAVPGVIKKGKPSAQNTPLAGNQQQQMEVLSRKAQMYPVFADTQKAAAATDSKPAEITGTTPAKGTFSSNPAPEPTTQTSTPVASKPAVQVRPQQGSNPVDPAAKSLSLNTPNPSQAQGTFSSAPAQQAPGFTSSAHGTFITAPPISQPTAVQQAPQQASHQQAPHANQPAQASSGGVLEGDGAQPVIPGGLRNTADGLKDPAGGSVPTFGSPAGDAAQPDPQAPAPAAQLPTFAPTLQAPARPTVAPTPAAESKDKDASDKPQAPAQSTFGTVGGEAKKTLHMPQAAGKKAAGEIPQKDVKKIPADDADVELIELEGEKPAAKTEKREEYEAYEAPEKPYKANKHEQEEYDDYGRPISKAKREYLKYLEDKERESEPYPESDGKDRYPSEGPYDSDEDEDKVERYLQPGQPKKSARIVRKPEPPKRKEHHPAKEDHPDREHRPAKKDHPAKDHHAAKDHHPAKGRHGPPREHKPRHIKGPHHSKDSHRPKGRQHPKADDKPAHTEEPHYQDNRHEEYPEERPYDAHSLSDMPHEEMPHEQMRHEEMRAEMQGPDNEGARPRDMVPDQAAAEEVDHVQFADPRPMDSAIGGAEEDASKPMIVTLGDYVMRQGSFGTGVVARDDAPGWISRLAAAYGDKAQVVNKGQATATSEVGVKMVQDLLQDYPDAASRVKLVVLSFGGNDAITRKGETATKVAIDQYKSNIKTMVSTLREAGIQNLLLVTPPPAARRMDRRFKTVKDYAKAASEVAKTMNVPAVDLFAAVASLQNWQAAAMKTDGLRLSERGQQLLFKRVMKALGSKLQSVSPAKLKPVSS